MVRTLQIIEWLHGQKRRPILRWTFSRTAIQGEACRLWTVRSRLKYRETPRRYRHSWISCRHPVGFSAPGDEGR